MTALTVAAWRGVRQVLAGRDAAGGWRSAAARRKAAIAGWLGWALLAGAVFLAVGHGAVSHGARAGWAAVEMAVSLAVALAPRWPLLGWRIAYLGVLATPLIPGQSHADAGKYVILAIATCVAGLRYPRRVLWAMTALTLVPVWLWTGPDWVYPAVNTGLFAVLGAVLDMAGRWRRDRRALAEQTERAAGQAALAERETARAKQQAARAEREFARRAVLEERARIAREMHDIVAHHMSMIAVQAETAPFRLAGADEPVRAEFAALSSAAREALTEMRKLLGVLRSDPGDAAERMPQPGLADLPGLVEIARRAGSRVRLSVGGDAALLTEGGAVPASVGLCAYRIAQESLSNAGRHAPGAAISVGVEARHGCVQLTVINEPSAAGRLPDGGSGDDGTTANGTGHGLSGMRERVALLGGSLRAGPEPGGGFAVRAMLPWGEDLPGSPGAPAPEEPPAALAHVPLPDPRAPRGD